MISALAFGYGIGMATPDATLDSMRNAVGDAHAVPGHAFAGRGATVPNYPQQPGYYPADAYAPVPGGPLALGHSGHAHPLERRAESDQLARLRSPYASHSCKIHPTQSTEPSYASQEPGDGVWGDIDHLDPAGKEALSRLQLPDFNVPVTRGALKYVRFLTRSSRGRGLFESWLKRSGRHQDMILEALREWHLPEDLIWVAMIESGFDPRAKSPAGAMGLWQFMKATGSVYGLEVNQFMDQRKNPQVATRAAAHHLRDLYQRFGSWDLAMAAYNMGYEQLLDRIDRYGTTDFSELARQRALPSETINYVPKIIAAALVANNLERYGFDDVKIYRPESVAEISVPSGTSIGTIAKAAGISARIVRKHNPHVLTAHVPPGYKDFIIYLPSDSISRARAALPSMLDERVAYDDADILDPNDLSGFGRKRSKHLRHHMWNEDENLLSMLPKPKRRSLRSRVGDPLEREPRKVYDENFAAVAEEFKPKRADREIVMYRVTKGETLIGVARQFALDVDDLARDNAIESDSKLREGALLKLMVKRDVLKGWTNKVKREAAASNVKPKKKKSDDVDDPQGT